LFTMKNMWLYDFPVQPFKKNGQQRIIHVTSNADKIRWRTAAIWSDDKTVGAKQTPSA